MVIFSELSMLNEPSDCIAPVMNSTLLALIKPQPEQVIPLGLAYDHSSLAHHNSRVETLLATPILLLEVKQVLF